MTRPPLTIPELMQRAQQLAGMSLQQLALRHRQPVPNNLLHHKGWVGQLIEQELGASAGSRAEPDFSEIGVELKTIPVNAKGEPKESTYVCTVSLDSDNDLHWNQSWIRQKLNHVLWLPVEAEPNIPVGERRIGSGILCKLNKQQDVILEQDWVEHMEMITTGRINEISAHHGTWLQVRPKAANSKASTLTTDEDGNHMQTLPRGFYLRTAFTAQILKLNYL